MIPRTKVFVGSLPPGSKPEELRRLFENYGVVTECDIMNRCGFVHMETQEMAENAIKALNNTNFKGSTICVEPGRMKDKNSSVGNGASKIGMSNAVSRRNSNMKSDQGNNRNGRGNYRPEHSRDLNGQRNSGAGGPIRRDRNMSFRNGNTPYSRNVGSNAPDRWQNGFKGNQGRNFDMNMNSSFNNGHQNGLNGNSGINDRYNNGMYGMSNQDRRGFALPERHVFPENMNSQSPLLVNGNMRNSNGLRGYSQSLDTRSPNGGFKDGRNMFQRRNPSCIIDGGNNDSLEKNNTRNKFMNGTRIAEGQSFSNYNQQFPPLGPSGRGDINRNGPQRQNMMTNRRY